MRHINAFALLLFLVSSPAPAQTPEADVLAAVKRTVEAYNKGDSVAFNAHFMPTVRGFFVDNGVLTSADDIQAPAASPQPKPSVTLRHVNVRVYGNAAVIAAYFDGTLYVGSQPKRGTWRFTETRVKDGNAWKVVQFHFSPLQPAIQ